MWNCIFRLFLRQFSLFLISVHVILLLINAACCSQSIVNKFLRAEPLAVQEAALFTPLSSATAVVLALRDGKQVNALQTGEELTSSAAPIVVGDAVFVTTEHGLVAFARPIDSTATKQGH